MNQEREKFNGPCPKCGTIHGTVQTPDDYEPKPFHYFCERCNKKELISKSLFEEILLHLRYLEGVEECQCDAERPIGCCYKCDPAHLADRMEEEREENEQLKKTKR